MLSEHAILIVEADIHLGKFLERQLVLNKYSVNVANDGKNAGVELTRNHCDLVILALNLPGLDGIDLLKKIRLTQPGLPILVLSARNRTEDIVRGLEEGADDYLTKPFSFRELSARIRVLLSRNDVAAAAVSVARQDLALIVHHVFQGSRTRVASDRFFWSREMPDVHPCLSVRNESRRMRLLVSSANQQLGIFNATAPPRACLPTKTMLVEIGFLLAVFRRT